MAEAESVMERILSTQDTFPSISTVRDELNHFRREKVKPVEVVHEKWVSKSAPGTPAHWEAFFMLMWKGALTDQEQMLLDAHLRMKRRRFTEDQITEFYELWKLGQVHPLIGGESPLDELKEIL